MTLWYLWLEWEGKRRMPFAGDSYGTRHKDRRGYAEFLRVECTDMTTVRPLIPGRSWLAENTPQGHTHISWVSEDQ